MRKTALQRAKYRKWADSEESALYYLKVYPDGSMLEISVRSDDFTDIRTICRTKRTGQMDENFFLKHRQVCSKEEFENELKKTKELLK